MSHIELKLVADNASDLSALVGGLYAQLGVTAASAIALDAPVEPAKEITPKASKPAALKAEKATKEIAGEPAAAEKREPTPEPSPGETPEDSASSDVTYSDVQAAVVALAAAKGRGAAAAVLDTFGVDHGKKLTEEQWPDAVAALTAALEG